MHTFTALLHGLLLSLPLLACGSASGETTTESTGTTASTTAADPSTSTSTSTSTGVVGSTGPDAPTTSGGAVSSGGQSSTGTPCPENACSGHEDVGFCEGDDETMATAIPCVVDENGCRVPGEPAPCVNDCRKGVCCGEFGKLSCSCVTNVCLDNNLPEGWSCFDNQEVLCDQGAGCFNAFNNTPKDCGAATCSPETGTCGGCIYDNCYGSDVGDVICAPFNGQNEQEGTCALVDGCIRLTNLTDCEKSCGFGGCQP